MALCTAGFGVQPELSASGCKCLIYPIDRQNTKLGGARWNRMYFARRGRGLGTIITPGNIMHTRPMRRSVEQQKHKPGLATNQPGETINTFRQICLREKIFLGFLLHEINNKITQLIPGPTPGIIGIACAWEVTFGWIFRIKRI